MCVVLPVALVDPSSKKKGPYSNSGKKFGKILKIWKNTLENSEKYSEKFGKILQKNSETYSKKFGKILPKIRIPDAKSLFPTMPIRQYYASDPSNRLHAGSVMENF